MRTSKNIGLKYSKTLFIISALLLLTSITVFGNQINIGNFTKGMDGWSTDSGELKVSRSADGKKLLHWEYRVKPGGFNLLYKKSGAGKFKGMTKLILMLKSDRSGILAINLNEKDGSTYQTYVRLTKDAWTKYDLPPSQFLFDRESRDENGRLDLDEVTMITIGEIGGFTGQLEGRRNIWIDSATIIQADTAKAEAVIKREVPSFGKDYDYSTDIKWLNARIKEWKPSRLRPMKFGINTQVFLGAGYLSQGKNTTESIEFAKEMIGAAKECGVEIIRVGGLDDAWRTDNQKEIELADRLVKDIKSNGLKLMIVDTQHSEYLMKNPVVWDKFKSIHKERVSRITKRYKPDYYVVVIEPTTYHYWGVKEKLDLSKWEKLTRAGIEAVKTLSPKTLTGICIDMGDVTNETYFSKVLHMKNLDIVGIQIYKPYQFERAQALLKDHPHKFGKQLWMLETWSGMPYPFTNITSKEEEDAKWIEASFYFAQKNDFDGYLPWPFQYFITYDRIYDKTGRINYKNRTRPFTTYKKLIEDAFEKKDR